MHQVRRIFTVPRFVSALGVASALALPLVSASAGAEDARPEMSGGMKSKRSEDVSSVEREAFSIESKPAKVKVGKAVPIVVAVKAKGSFHLNQDYPHKLTFDEVPAGLHLEKTDLKRGDAELDEHTLTFKVDATPEKAGKHLVKATLKTSVCDEKQCILKSEKLTLRVLGR